MAAAPPLTPFTPLAPLTADSSPLSLVVRGGVAEVCLNRPDKPAHLLALNRGRHTAYIDDRRQISYGELDEAVRRCASGLLALGLRREEGADGDARQHRLSHRLLGAVHAARAPVNTLAWPLPLHAGACPGPGVLVSAPLAASLRQVVADSGRGAAAGERPPIRPTRLLTPFRQPAGCRPADRGRRHRRRRLRLLAVFLRLHRPAQGHGALACQPVLDGRTLWQAGAGHPAGRRAVLGGQAVFCLWPGQRPHLCPERRRHHRADGRAADPQRGLQALDGPWRDRCFSARPPATPACWLRPTCHRAARSGCACVLLGSAGEALPREVGERFTRHTGAEVIDGIGSTEMLHIFLSNRPGDVHYGTTGRPVPGYRLRLVAEDGSDTPPGEIGETSASAARARPTCTGATAPIGGHLPGRVDPQRRQVPRRRAGLLCCYAGRSDDMLKVSGLYVSPFEVEATLMQGRLPCSRPPSSAPPTRPA